MSDFCFESSAKKYHTIQLEALISVYALEYLVKNVTTPTHPQKWVDVVQRLNDVCAVLQTEETHSKTNTNDTTASDLETNWDNSGYYATVKDCKIVMGISSNAGKKFRPSAQSHPNFTQDQSSWGWDIAQLKDDISELRKISNALDVSINTVLIKRVLSHQEKIDDGEFVLRTFDPVKDLACSTAYAIYLGDAQGGYADQQWETVALCNARLYQSEEVAQEAIDKYDYYKRLQLQYTIIPVSLNIAPTSHTMPRNLSEEATNSLQQAFAFQEKRQIEEMLEKLTVEKLKERLAQLEEPIVSVQPKKKM